jgi:hypothetical protein
MVKAKPGQDQDEAALEACLGFIDFYGEVKQDRQPENREKSRSGAIISTIVRIIVCVLILFVILRFSEIERGYLDGETIILNPRRLIPGYSVGIFEFGKAAMDFPAIELEIQTATVHFDDQYTTLTGVHVEEASGKQYALVTPSLQNEELSSGIESRGAIMHRRLGMNNINENSSNADTPMISSVFYSSPSTSMENAITQRAVLSQQYGPEILQMEEFASKIAKQQFVPHQATMYIRLRVEQLKSIKSCMVQIALTNQGIAELQRIGQLNPAFADTAITSDPSTWLPSNFNPKSGTFDHPLTNLNTFKVMPDYLQFIPQKQPGVQNSSISCEGMLGSTCPPQTPVPVQEVERTRFFPDKNFMNYLMSVNFVNNFNYTFTSYYCKGQDPSKSKFEQSVLGGKALNMTDNQLEIKRPIDSQKFPPDADEQYWPLGPRRLCSLRPTFCTEECESTNGKDEAGNIVPCFPFTVLVAGLWGRETLQVTGLNKRYMGPMVDTVSSKTILPAINRSTFNITRGYGGSIIRDQTRPWQQRNGSAIDPNPIAGAAKWNCKKTYWGTADGCDCECGMYDPDCDQSSTFIYNCPQESTVGIKSYCTRAAECAPHRFGIEDKDGAKNNVMSVSLPCTTLYAPFDNLPVGYNGDYLKEVGNKCPACPEDPIYFKEVQRNRQGRLTCNLRPELVMLDIKQIDSLQAPGVTYQLKKLMTVQQQNLNSKY